MQKRLLILITLSLSSFLYCSAQTNAESNAILLSLKGEGKIVRNNIETKLAFPFIFQAKDLVIMQSGQCLIMLSDGKEIIVTNKKQFLIPEDIVAKTAFRNFDIQSQDLAAFKMRPLNKDIFVFPKATKCIDINESFLYWKSDDPKEKIVELSVLDLLTADELIKIDSIEENIISINQLNLKKGADYYWIIKAYETKREAMGTIKVLSDEEINQFPKFTLNSKSEYLEAIYYSINNEFYFRAINLCHKAMKKHPETDLFDYIYKGLLNKTVDD